MNAVAHIAGYLSNKMGVTFATGESFDTNDGVSHPRNSQYPMIVLKGVSADMSAFAEAVRASDLPHLGFIREMIETTDDAEIVAMLAKKSESDIEYLGIGVFGPHDTVKALTKQFSLWK